MNINLNLKTVGSQSIIGPGNIPIPENISDLNDDLELKTINDQSIKGTGNIVITGGGSSSSIPLFIESQSGMTLDSTHINKFIVFDATDSEIEVIFTISDDDFSDGDTIQLNYNAKYMLGTIDVSGLSIMNPRPHYYITPGSLISFKKISNGWLITGCEDDINFSHRYDGEEYYTHQGTYFNKRYDFDNYNNPFKYFVNEMMSNFGTDVNLNWVYLNNETSLESCFGTDYGINDNTLFEGRVDMLNTKNIESFNNIFVYNSKFNGDLSKWDVSNGIDFNYMFYNSSLFNNNSLKDWKINVIYILNPFYNSVFNGDLSGWDVSNWTNMRSLFENTVFNNDSINNWDVSSVSDMSYMFHDSYIGDKIDLSNWCVSNVSDYTNFDPNNILINPPNFDNPPC